MDLRQRYKNYQEGGLVSGEGALPHDMGGVPTVDGSGEQIAEVEGGERIFSIEDTQAMEQMAQQYMQSQDPNILTQLGQYVVEAIMRQEEVNPSEEVPMEEGMDMGMGQDMGMEQSMEQPMMKKGGKLPTRLGLWDYVEELD